MLLQFLFESVRLHTGRNWIAFICASIRSVNRITAVRYDYQHMWMQLIWFLCDSLIRPFSFCCTFLHVCSFHDQQRATIARSISWGYFLLVIQLMFIFHAQATTSPTDSLNEDRKFKTHKNTYINTRKKETKRTKRTKQCLKKEHV